MTDKKDSESVLINVRITPDQKVFIDAESARQGRPTANYIRRLIQDEMDRLAELRVLNDE